MNTKVAITSQDQQTISGHIGTCSHFFVYEIDEEGKYEKKSLPLNENQILHYSFHEDPSENPQNPLFEMDMIFANAMGQGAINNLAANGVRGHIIKETDPDIAIYKLIEGKLQAYYPEDHNHGGGGCGCGSHGHEHEHHHDHDGGCGCGSHDHHDEHEHQCGCGH